MKLFVDTNIVLDLLQFREPWIHDTLVLFQMAKDKEVELIVTDLTFINPKIRKQSQWQSQLQ